MVIYFLLCCIYGNFLINLEWSLILYQSCWNVHCIFHYYCWIVTFLSHPVGVPDLRRVEFLFKLECRSSTPEFYKDYFTMFAVCASFCVSISPSARVSSVRTVAKPHPERHDQATQPLLTDNIWIEAQCFLWEHGSPPSGTQSPRSLRGTNRHQFWL